MSRCQGRWAGGLGLIGAALLALPAALEAQPPAGTPSPAPSQDGFLPPPTTPPALPEVASPLPTPPEVPLDQKPPDPNGLGGANSPTGPLGPGGIGGGFGAGGFGNLFNPVLGKMQPLTSYRATWLPEQSVAGQGTRLGFVQEDFRASLPIWQDCNNLWSFNAGVRNEVFQGSAVLPDSRVPFPSDLWNIHLGTGYQHKFDNGWIAGVNLSVGSASDQPFSTINEMTVGVNASLRIPSGERNAWLFSVFYSSTSEIPFPIPGVAYLWNPSDQFQAVIGVPFMLIWRPVDDLTLSFTYAPLRNVHARATYKVGPKVRLYAGYDWNNEGYFLADRQDDRDRFFYYEQRLTVGVRVPVTKHFFFDVSSGYAFDRFYFQGQAYQDSHHDRVDVGDTPFGAVQAVVRW